MSRSESVRDRPLLVSRAEVVERERRERREEAAQALEARREGHWPSGPVQASDPQRVALKAEPAIAAAAESDEASDVPAEWLLAVRLLMSLDLRRRASAEDLEKSIAAFLAQGGSRQIPDVEIFLRGVARNVWDIDRLLQELNPEDELRRMERNPLALSVLRTLTHELMWSVESTEWFECMARQLTNQCSLVQRADRDCIVRALVRMKEQMLRTQSEWDAKHQLWAQDRHLALTDGPLGAITMHGSSRRCSRSPKRQRGGGRPSSDGGRP